MEIKIIKYPFVGLNGAVPEGGAVETLPFIRMGAGEGCGLPSCQCSEGYWITISEGRLLDGSVTMIKATFKNNTEYDKFLKNHNLFIKNTHHCDVCGIDFEGEPGEHINAEHYDDIHSSESMTRFEETHISEVD